MIFIRLSLEVCSAFSPITHSNDDCLSLERNLPKLANQLKWFILYNALIDHSCVRGIAYLLNTSLNHLTLQNCIISSTDFDCLTTAIATSKLKKLKISYFHWSRYTIPFGFNLVRGRSLAKLLTQSKTLEEVRVELSYWEYTNDCGVVRLLLEAMAHSSVKKLIVDFLELKICDVSDIHYDRDRVEVN